MSTRLVATGFGLLLASVIVLAAVFGGWAGLAYLALWCAATAPGLPLGWALFGRRHAAGWVTGLCLGYATSCLTIWAAIFTGFPTVSGFAVAWLLGATGAIGCARGIVRWSGRAPLVTLPPWGPRESAALALVLLLVPLLVGPPVARVGSRDANGDRRYRAYFTADFVWHMAMTAELQKHARGPVNPYLAPEPIHYYWTYFLVPAAAAPLAAATPEVALKVNLLGTALLLVSATFVATVTAVPGLAMTAAAALALVILAASLEGVAALAYTVLQGQGLAGVRDLNVDALSRGVGGLRIDNLPRAMWYTPQHAFSYAIGLGALPVALHAPLGAPAGAIFIAGLALAGSVACNPFVGGLLCAVYGLAVIGHWWRQRSGYAPVLRHAVAIAPVVGALGWAALNHVADGAGSTLHFGPYGPTRNWPIVAFGLSFGPLLIPIALGLLPNATVPFWRVWPSVAGAVLMVLVMHFVVMTVDEFWIGFRTGHLFFVLVPPLVARGLSWLRTTAPPKVAALVVGAVLVAGLPTTVIDAWNAQDVENQHQGIGLRWTISLTPAQQAGLAWLREHTPSTAIVQMEPTVRARDTWSLIPSFGERRMAAGLPISLMHVPEYDRRTEAVRDLYASPDAESAWRTAAELGIDYLWVDGVERTAYPSVRKFAEAPSHFERRYANDEVEIFRVIRADTARTSGTR